MKYPQAYLFLDNNQPFIPAQLTALANGNAIYIPKYSHTNKALDESIALVADAAAVINSELVGKKISAVVVESAAINAFFLTTLIGRILSVCWIDNRQCLQLIYSLLEGRKELSFAIASAHETLHHYGNAEGLVDAGIVPRPTTDISLIDFAFKLCERRKELEASIQLKIKSTVRHGILDGIDLQ
jgi:hypothetical protein